MVLNLSEILVLGVITVTTGGATVAEAVIVTEADPVAP